MVAIKEQTVSFVEESEYGKFKKFNAKRSA
jgi:hypothetical protein